MIFFKRHLFICVLLIVLTITKCQGSSAIVRAYRGKVFPKLPNIPADIEVSSSFIEALKAEFEEKDTKKASQLYKRGGLVSGCPYCMIAIDNSIEKINSDSITPFLVSMSQLSKRDAKRLREKVWRSFE